jgi:hypothetical protein
VRLKVNTIAGAGNMGSGIRYQHFQSIKQAKDPKLSLRLIVASRMPLDRAKLMPLVD